MRGMTTTALIVRTAGTNCDLELAYAFELAGAEARIVHLNSLVADPAPLAGCDLIGLPGGFSYGDDIAAGRIFANRIRHQLWQPLLEAVTRGVGIIGICNGFQVLAKLGLLPDPHRGRQLLTLAENTTGRFVDRWVGMRCEGGGKGIWTRDLPEQFELPVAHGEGRLTAEEEVLDELAARGQLVLRYAEGDNPNGSKRDVAGLCDPTGRILGLMPHPERAVAAHQHPAAGGGRYEREAPVGFTMLRGAVTAVEVGVGVQG